MLSMFNVSFPQFAFKTFLVLFAILIKVTSFHLLRLLLLLLLLLMLFTLMFGLHLFFLLIAINTVIFVEQFIKYIWFYALQNKSKAYFVFVTFKSLVENYFSFTINSLFADNGGEYVALCSFLSTNGNSHLTTPYTPEHNGYSERRHRHIVETVLALFHRASF